MPGAVVELELQVEDESIASVSSRVQVVSSDRYGDPWVIELLNPQSDTVLNLETASSRKSGQANGYRWRK